ncbi:unnamed protein product [Coregonus sp. 'balchen']|nr:unnamed protein product [Coregonus sp. 'balchen']
MATRLDNLLHARRRPFKGFGSLPGTSSETEPTKRGVGPPRNTCPRRKTRRGSDRRSRSSPAPSQVGVDVPCSAQSTQLILLPVTFPDYPGPPLSPALVDSGAAGNFLDRSVALSLRIPLVPLQSHTPVHALDNHPLGTGLVRQTMIPISLTVNHNHHERITFLILDSPAHPVVLESPDQATHIPILEEYRDLKVALVTPIIPLSRFVAPVVWNVDTDIR